MNNLKPEEIIKIANNPAIEWPKRQVNDIQERLIAIEEAMCSIWLDNMHDSEIGSVTEDGLHVFRVANWTLSTDSQGFVDVLEHNSRLEAHQYMENMFGILVNLSGE